MKDVKIECAVGSVTNTQADIKASKKAEINASTEAKIFKALGVENKEQALITQITQLSKAVAFLATKTDKRTLTNSEKSAIESQLSGFEDIKAVVEAGKTAKAKL